MITKIGKITAQDGTDLAVGAGLAVGGTKAGNALAGKLGQLYFDKVVGDFKQTNPELMNASQKDIDGLLQAAKLKDKVVIHKTPTLGGKDAFFAGPITTSYTMQEPGNGFDLFADPRQNALKRFLKSKKLHSDEGLTQRVLRHGVVVINDKPDLDILAHEIGHAHNPNGLGRQILYGSGVMAATPAAALSSLGTYKRTIDKLRGKKDANTGATYAVNAIGAVPAAAVLGEEGRASLNGLKYLKEISKSADARKAAAKRLGKAFGTYGIKVGVPLAALNAGAYGVAHLQHQIEKRINHGNKDSK